MIKPAALRRGDKVAAISLSRGWPGVYPRAWQDGKRQIEEAFGIEIVASRHALKDIPWLAAHPEARADDLTEVLKDPSIRGIISNIGGDDSIRMIPFLDLSVIRDHPKIFLGYSDSTITHFAFFKAGVTSYYGPSLMAGFDENGGLLRYMEDSVRQTLFEPRPSLLIPPNSAGWTIAPWNWGDEKRNDHRRSLELCSGWKWLQGRGRHRGRLIGGCLEAVDWLRGTPLWPDLSMWLDSILFLETSEDQPSPAQVTYMLRSMGAAGVLAQVRAILYGRPYGQPSSFEAYDRVLLSVLGELGLQALPLVTCMDFGHTDPKFILPLGIEAEVDCDSQEFRLVEPPTNL